MLHRHSNLTGETYKLTQIKFDVSVGDRERTIINSWRSKTKLLRKMSGRIRKEAFLCMGNQAEGKGV